VPLRIELPERSVLLWTPNGGQSADFFSFEVDASG
jgi:hypothetical protein